MALLLLLLNTRSCHCSPLLAHTLIGIHTRKHWHSCRTIIVWQQRRLLCTIDILSVLVTTKLPMVYGLTISIFCRVSCKFFWRFKDVFANLVIFCCFFLHKHRKQNVFTSIFGEVCVSFGLIFITRVLYMAAARPVSPSLSRAECEPSLKPGFHYPSWRARQLS